MERPQERPLTQWPVFPAKHPVYESPPNELHRCPGRIENDVPAWQQDDVSRQAANNPQADNTRQAINTLRPQPSRDLLKGSTARRDRESTANVEYHEYLRESALLANDVGSMDR